MSMIKLDENFWTERYELNESGWDIGKISMPLKSYIDQLSNKNIKILIPGGGNSYEAEYLFKKGFNNVFVVDLSKIPLENIKKRCANFPAAQLLHQNFFELDMTFDLIIEQTFFCALNPSLREKYAKKMHKLLNKNGKLVGLLFDDELNKDHPPFGGCKKEYETYFNPYFEIKLMERAHNSIEKRAGRELFINLVKR